MWIARDKSRELWLYRIKPKRVEKVDYIMNITDSFWSSRFQRYIGELPRKLFPKLKWEDEPMEVELIRKGKSNQRGGGSVV